MVRIYQQSTGTAGVALFLTRGNGITSYYLCCLKIQNRTFIEIGCNAGLFLKLATEYGFRNVVGVEMDKENCEAAKQYRDAHGMDYKILNRTVGVDFDFDELPVADVVLMSNMHYYIHMSKFIPFLDELFNKTIFCIVVSRHMK